jgi:hypothetical protein
LGSNNTRGAPLEVAIYEMLGDELFKVTTLDRGEVESKKKVKVKKWMNRAADIGRLNE